MQDPLASWAAILSAVATFIIAMLTFWNTRIAKNTLKLLEQKENRVLLPFEPYIDNAFIFPCQEQKSRILAVKLRLSNGSDSDKAIKELNLQIRLRRDGNFISNIIVPFVDRNIRSLLKKIEKDEENFIQLTDSIPARTVIKGWIFFELSDDFIGDSTIETYELIIIDALNMQKTLSLGILQEKTNEQKSMA